MSNFKIFDQHHLRLLLEPFGEGMAAHITPIKYEALTPDIFLLLFRTTAKNGEDYFFVSLETDYVQSIEDAQKIIEDWHGNDTTGFWTVESKQEADATDLSLDDFKSPTAGPYFAMLCGVKRPKSKGYWANAIVIMPGDDIGAKIKDFPDETQTRIRKSVNDILQNTDGTSTSYFDAYKAINKQTKNDDINHTNIAVSVYVRPDRSLELFYNVVDVPSPDARRTK